MKYGELLLVLIIIYVIYFCIKTCINKKKGVNSQEKYKIKQIVSQVIPDSMYYTAAYGTRSELDSVVGKSIITRYWYYAVAFRPGDLYLIPLSISKGSFYYSEPLHFGKENLGMAEAGKNVLSLYDRNRRPIMQLFVLPSNTKDDKYSTVNIQQKEEAAAFHQFAKDFMKEINLANGIMDIKEAKKAL